MHFATHLRNLCETLRAVSLNQKAAVLLPPESQDQMEPPDQTEPQAWQAAR